MGSYLYMVQMDIPAELESEFHRLYDEQHVPNLLAVPGVRSCSRYQVEETDAEGMARFVALYEVDSPDIPQSPAWKEQSDKGDWITSIRPHAYNRSRSLLKKIS